MKFKFVSFFGDCSVLGWLFDDFRGEGSRN